jgi:hypothetical protein
MKISMKKTTKKAPVEIKKISFDLLKEIRDYNLSRLNRNIELEELSSEIPNLNTKKYKLIPILIHNHHLGKLIEPHIRCIVTLENGETLGIQDIFFSQWENDLK